MAHKVFTEEYQSIRLTLRRCAFPAESRTLIDGLKRLAQADGPDVGAASALDTLRAKCERGFFQEVFGTAKDKESKGILKLAGDGADEAAKAAALKTFRHLHLMTKFGGHSLWILALPKSYRKWPSDEFKGREGENLAALLKDNDGRFGSKQMRDLTTASQMAGAWANKASAICAGTRMGAENAATLIRRWFGDENTTDDDVTRIASTLKEGYKKIAVAALGHKMVLTDNPIDRGTEDEKTTNAYVWYDKLNVIYIEGAFFEKAEDPLSGMPNWARILVHELSHNQINTDDHAYRWQGLKPKSNSFPSAKAIANADSWAFFAADANGALTQRHRNFCLK